MIRNANTSSPVGLPAMVEELLIDVAADGFTLHCCGPKTVPNALVASYEWMGSSPPQRTVVASSA